MALLHPAILVLIAGPDADLTNAYLIPGLNLSHTMEQVNFVLLAAPIITHRVTLWVKINYQTGLNVKRLIIDNRTKP